VFCEHRCAARSCAATKPGDDEERVNLVNRDRIDRPLYLIDVLFGDLRAEFVVGADAVSFHARLTNEHTLVLTDVLETHQVRFRCVHRCRGANNLGAGPLVVLQELVDYFPSRLSKADHCQFHRELTRSIGCAESHRLYNGSGGRVSTDGPSCVSRLYVVTCTVIRPPSTSPAL